MKYSNKRALSAILIVLMSCVFCVSILQKKVGVQYGSSRTVRSLLNIHESDEYWICVNGEKYDGVIGYEPYYLKIPYKDYIFFVTRGNFRGPNSCHFVSISGNGENYEIKSDDDFVGSDINSKSTWSDKIESVNWPQVVIIKHFENKKFIYTFDLSKNIITVNET